MKKNKQEKLFSARSQLLNIGIIIAILVLTLIVLFNNIFDTKLDLSKLEVFRWWWLPLGALFMVLSMLCEAKNLSMILKKIGHNRSMKENIVYASSDLYFSAITPSASGGQPAAAYYMTKSGIPLSQSSAILVLNVTIYTVGLIVVSLIAFIARPDFYAAFDPAAKVCVWLGIGFHALLATVCFLFMFSRKIVMIAGTLVIRLLSVLRIFKNKEEKLESFRASIETYRDCVSIIRGNPALIIKLLVNAVMQRLFLMPITYLAFLALGVEAGFFDILFMQMYCTVGASAIPLPGAVGISESLHMFMFEPFFASAQDPLLAFSMILSRSVSGYLSIIVCGCITMTYHVRHVIRPRRALEERAISEENELSDDSDELDAEHTSLRENLPIS